MRMRIAWFLTALLAAALSAHATHPPKVQWLDTLAGLGGAYGSCVTQTSDGGYVAVGSTGVDSLGSDMYFYYYVTRIDSAGDTLWTATIARESVGHEAGTARGILQTKDGGFVVVGSDNGADYHEYPFLVKLDSTGTLVWQSLIASDTFEHVSAVQRTPDGGLVLAGPLDQKALYLMKVDSIGRRLWCRTLDEEETPHMYECDGRQGWPPLILLAATRDGGFVTAGRNSNFGLILWKINGSGMEVWRRTYGSDSAAGGRAIAGTADGGFVIAGCAGMSEPYRPSSTFLLKVDSLGRRQWCRYHGKGKPQTSCSVSQTSEGGFVMTGSVTSAKYRRPQTNASVLRTDHCGNELWHTVIPSSRAEVSCGSCVQQTSDGGYVVCGTLGWRVGPGFHARLFVAKLAPEGKR